MKIREARVKELNLGDAAYDWYLDNASHITDLKELLLRVDAKNPDWCRWLFTRLMTRRQCIEIAIFSAEQVIDVYERKYGSNDARPRNAIDAAKAVLKSDTKKNRDKAYAAAWSAAYAATAAAYASANAAYAAADAANAAWSAAYAANAAANAEYAAAANAAAMRHRIITEAVRILDEK
jgi:hypothetical protein